MLDSRALSTFIALTAEDLRLPSETRWIRVLSVSSVAAVLASVPVSHYSKDLFGLGVLCGLILIAKLYLGGSIVSRGPSDEKRRLFQKLDRRRASHGIDSVIPAGMLLILENEAFRWEQVEAILENSFWREQTDLSVAIQDSANEFMAEMVMRYQATPNDRRFAENSNKLRNLLSALESVDRWAFAYARASDRQAIVPPPGIPETERLIQALSTCQK